MILYRICRGAILIVCRLYWRVTYEGLENLPSSGAYVVAPVHRSFIDFGLVAGMTRRRLRYMGKDSLWKYGLPGRLWSALGAFPVHRGAADREALRRCIEVIAEGEPLVLFPEGTRRSGPVVEELFEGTAYVAARTGVPIVPIGIGGSERALQKGKRLPRPVKVHVIIGAPIEAPPLKEGRRSPGRSTLRELSERLQKEVQRLFDDAETRARAAS
ncbi:MAG TPA: lysophospholipid acyltransferase family protein [Acidimicrobiales bacterium]|nr:lysophospholipid acyltransferase family protein [Acidimicrobiales bacterium]